MGTSVRPEKTTVQKMMENLRFMRARPDEFSREDIEQEIQFWKAKLDDESARERKLSGAEKVAAVGSKVASGATFGFFDELSGDKDTQRYLQGQLAEENPALAFGAEVVGGLAVPGSFIKVARHASTASRLARAGGEGMIQGGLAGLGNAQGGIQDRVQGGLEGAALGSAAAGALSGTGRIISATRNAAAAKRGVHTPVLEDLVASLPDESIAAARARFAEMSNRGLAGEAKMADVLPDGEGLLRAQRTANKDVARMIDSDLRGRSTRLANVADERLSQHTGTQRQSARKSVDALNEESAAKARPLYQAAEQEAATANATEVETMRLALEQPFVQQRIAKLRQKPRSMFKDMADDDHRLLDKVYKDIGKEIRSPKAKQDWSYREDLMEQRDILRDAIAKRAPSYPKALAEFADPQARREAYELGAKADTPADVIPSEMKSLDVSEAPLYREGKAQSLRANVPNPDLGEFARFSDVLAPVSSREKAEVFKATFGEDAYREYMGDLMEMAKMQRLRAGAGESTTVDKLLEQLQVSNPDLMDVVGLLAGGVTNPRGWMSAAVNRVGIDRLLSSKRNAAENAEFLLANPGQSLDALGRIRALARTPRHPALLRRDWVPTLDLIKNAAAREAGAVVGRRTRE